MSKRQNLSNLDRNLLLALLQCRGEAYGVELQEEIADRTGRRLSPGAIYTALARLEDAGLLDSRMGEPTAVRGGRRKRFYDITPVGEEALEASIAELRSMTRGLEPRFRLS